MFDTRHRKTRSQQNLGYLVVWTGWGLEVIVFSESTIGGKFGQIICRSAKHQVLWSQFLVTTLHITELDSGAPAVVIAGNRLLYLGRWKSSLARFVNCSVTTEREVLSDVCFLCVRVSASAPAFRTQRVFGVDVNMHISSGLNR